VQLPDAADSGAGRGEHFGELEFVERGEEGAGGLAGVVVAVRHWAAP
jgi:hypothetical protein